MSGFGGFGSGTSGGGLFGAKPPEQGTVGFGVPTTTVTTTATGLTFGTPTFGTGGTGLFGTTQQTQGFGFGIKPATTTTASTGFSFGSSATPTFGATNANTSVPTFGSLGATSTPAFGTSSLTFGKPTTATGFIMPTATTVTAPTTAPTYTPLTFGLANTTAASTTAPATLTFGVPATATATATPTTTQTTGFNLSQPATTSSLTFGTPKTTGGLTFGTGTTGFGTTSTTTAPTFNFGATTTTSAAAPATSTLSFGTTATTTAPTFNFGATTTAATTTATPSFNFGTTTSAAAATTTTTAPSFNFGTTTATAAPTFNFGTTTTTAPTLGGTGIFGAPKTTGTVSITTSTTTTSVGLGGVDNTQTTQGLSGSGTLEPKQAKDHNLPDVILQTLNDFQNFTKQQKSISVEISHGSSKPLKKVQEDTEAMESLLTTITSGLTRNAIALDKLKTETAQGLHQAEMAQRNHETPPGLEYDNSAPADYFNDLVTKFETDTVRLRVQIEASEKHLRSLTQSSTISPQELTLAMRRLHETLIVLAARVQALHTTVQSQKEQYKNLRRVYFKDDTNIFENDTDQSRVKKQTIYSLRSLTGPTPFSETPGTGPPLFVDGLAMLASSGANMPTTSANPNWMSPLQASTNTGSLLPTSNIFSTPQPTENQGFQLSKPPIGNKRNKR